jgi:hypothetical protein
MDGHPVHAMRYLRERKEEIEKRVMLELEHVFRISKILFLSDATHDHERLRESNYSKRDGNAGSPICVITNAMSLFGSQILGYAVERPGKVTGQFLGKGSFHFKH